MRVLFLLLLLFTLTPGHAENTEVDEYNDVPPGLLLPQSGAAPASAPSGTAATETPRLIGMDDIIAAYRRGDFAAAAAAVEPLAKNGHHPAEELLGILYHNGQGIQKNPALALQWLTTAAEAGQPLAQHHLAVMLFSEDGMEKDPVKALMWLHLALAHYPEGTEKKRAREDAVNIAAQLTRRDKDRARELAQEWLDKNGGGKLPE